MYPASIAYSLKREYWNSVHNIEEERADELDDRLTRWHVEQLIYQCEIPKKLLYLQDYSYSAEFECFDEMFTVFTRKTRS